MEIIVFFGGLALLFWLLEKNTPMPKRYWVDSQDFMREVRRDTEAGGRYVDQD